MSKSKKLGEQLKELIKTLEESPKELVQGSALEVIDLSLAYSHMFTPAAKRGMANKVKNLINKREIKVIRDLQTEAVDRVHYFSVIAVGEDKLVKAARVITNDINFLAAKGYVTGCLAPLSCIRLATEPFQLEEFGVFCYVSLTEEGTRFLEKEACGSHLKDADTGQIPSLRIT